MKNVVVLVISVFLLAVPVLSQTTGTITGKVTDDAGKALPGANIAIKGMMLGASSDMDGKYEIKNVPVGQFSLVAEFIGYRSVTKEIVVSNNASITVDFSLMEDALQMDAIVVVGTPGGAGMVKREASFAINTVDDAEMRRFSPSSTANLLELVPGVWSESSGGVAGANIFVRGLPSSGDAPFVTMSINGGPLYGTETLSFFEQSSIFRVDETVESTEASRGGPSAVFSNAEPGMTVNFNLRKGGETSKGRIKYETSDYDLQRVDGFLSGKLAENLYYMAGGYIRTSPGIRSTQFNAENGGQFTMQLTKVFSRGAINAFTRITNDHGQWVLPMALNTGNDLGTFSQLGTPTRFRQLQVNTQGDSAMFDFANGRGWKGSISGLNANIDLGAGWMVRDVLTYTGGDANTFGFVSNGNPIKVSALGMNTVKTRTGQTLSNSDYIQNYGHWVVMKNLESLNNDLSVNKQWCTHNITLGLYQARWSSVDFWTLGNYIPVHNVENGDILADDVTAQMVADAGGGAPWNYGIQSAGDARVSAVYAADSWQMMDALRVDLGVRYQMLDLEYTLDAGDFPDGEIDVAKSLEGKDVAFTGALNYDLTSELGVYGRYSDSYIFPHFDMIRENVYAVNSDGDFETNGFKQFEVGVKYYSQLISLFATGFFNKIDVFDGDVGATRESALLKTQTMGVELDAAIKYADFKIRGVGTLQNGEIKKADLAPDVVGNSIWRQPDVQFRIEPSYNRSFGSSDATLYAAYRYVGKRWDSRENVFQLDVYNKFDLGVLVAVQGNLTIGLHADNLNNSDGLTEGDPRDPASANGRPIFGRSFKFSVAYDF